MLPPRKTRTPLSKKEPGDETYPTLMITLKEGATPADTVQKISVLDINTAGMGIACTVPLNVGQSIFFTGDQPEWNLPKRGIVMWTFQDSDGFRAGIKFA